MRGAETLQKVPTVRQSGVLSASTFEETIIKREHETRLFPGQILRNDHILVNAVKLLMSHVLSTTRLSNVQVKSFAISTTHLALVCYQQTSKQ